jgi:uncharacterized protein with GYD domain
MPMYLTRFSYTPAAWAKLIENPVDRTKAVTVAIKSAGGKLHGLWYAFGEQDGFVLSEAPDNVSAVAALAAFGAAGAVSSTNTTVLISTKEMVEALEKAKSVTYRPPGA